MGKKEIASALRLGRERSGMTVQEILRELRKYGIDISDKTLYNYETGYRQPNADTLLVLCNIYNINDVFGALGYPSHQQENKLTTDEHQLIDSYRRLSSEGKRYINSTMSMAIRSFAEDTTSKVDPDEIDRLLKERRNTAWIAAYGQGPVQMTYTDEELEQIEKLLAEKRKKV